MTTGLSDKQLQDAYQSGFHHPVGLRAVADLAITHIEGELVAMRQENEELKK